MTDTLAQPQTPAEEAEVEYGNHIIFKMLGAKITSFGANANGEIFLQVEKDGEYTEVLIGVDSRGDIALFEPELVPVQGGAA